MLHVLKDVRRCNAHILKDWQAQAAIQGMLRSMTPIEDRGEETRAAWSMEDLQSTEYFKARLQAGMFVCRAILEEATGLTTSVNTLDVDELFKDMLESIRHLDANDDSEVLQEAMKLTKRVFHTLIKRASNPEKYMSKRAAAKYRRLVMRDDPPFPSTAHVATHICLTVGSAQNAQTAILQEFMCRPVCGVPLDETVRLVQEARDKEKEEDKVVVEQTELDDRTEEIQSEDGDNNDELEEATATTVDQPTSDEGEQEAEEQRS